MARGPSPNDSGEHDPASMSLADASDPGHDDHSEWAELRVSPKANRIHETHNFDQHGWKKAMSMGAAVETIVI